MRFFFRSKQFKVILSILISLIAVSVIFSIIGWFCLSTVPLPSVTGVFSATASTTSIPFTTLPAPSISISSQALSSAGSVFSLSRPFSYLPEASVRRPTAFAVSLTEGPLKQALSNTIVLVLSLISLFSPPIRSMPSSTLLPSRQLARASRSLCSITATTWTAPSPCWK